MKILVLAYITCLKYSAMKVIANVTNGQTDRQK